MVKQGERGVKFVKTQRVAVIGHPIGHTMSPFIHKRLYSLSKIPFEYSVLDIPSLEKGMDILRALDCFNVTIPHKGGIIPFLDGMDEKARLFGSVNTVSVRNGRLYGYTTDGTGALMALNNHGLDFSGELLILGNGGAARAIAFEAGRQCKELAVTLACRESSLSRAEELCQELDRFLAAQGKPKASVTVKSYEELERDTCRYDLLINATSVGMYPKAGLSPVSSNVILRCAAVFDAVYNPEETELLRIAGACGIKAVGGMEMLVYQAVAAHELWYGVTFDPEDIYRLCVDSGREMVRIFGGNEK